MAPFASELVSIYEHLIGLVSSLNISVEKLKMDIDKHIKHID